jgi:hypothetical protein
MSKWWHMSYVRPTPQYLSGICAGTGLGLMLGSPMLLGSYSLLIGGFLVAVGSSCALAAQRTEGSQSQCPK